MVNESRINEVIEKLFQEIEFKGEPRSLYEPLKYMIEIGGKRIRPRLMLLAYSLWHSELTPSVIEGAAAIEVFHSFTLMHDDIMDNAPIRRGKTTVWKKWNANAAILSGDVMLIDAYKRYAACAQPEILPAVLELFSDTADKVCQGQQLDMEFEDREKITMDEYIQMIGLKTSELLACSAKMGAIFAGASSQDAEVLYRYAYLLGLAFQIMDDYLDTYGDVAVFGKSIGGDILCDKKTWLLTKTLESVDGSFLKKEYASPEEKIAAVRAIYDSQNIAQQALAEVERYNNLALEELSKLSLSQEALAPLYRYADALLKRNK